MLLTKNKIYEPKLFLEKNLSEKSDVAEMFKKKYPSIKIIGKFPANISGDYQKVRDYYVICVRKNYKKYYKFLESTRITKNIGGLMCVAIKADNRDFIDYFLSKNTDIEDYLDYMKCTIVSGNKHLFDEYYQKFLDKYEEEEYHINWPSLVNHAAQKDSLNMMQYAITIGQTMWNWEQPEFYGLIENNKTRLVKYFTEKLGSDYFEDGIREARICDRKDIAEYFIKKMKK